MWPFRKKSAPEAGGDPIRDALANARSFSAAEVDEILGPWTFDSGFSNGEIGGALATVRSRCRDMAKNSEYFHRWIQLFVANVVGPGGFRFKSTAEAAERPSAVGAPDSAAALFLETHWERWASDPGCVDAAGAMDLPALLRLAAEGWARDGEAFIIIDRAAQNPYGISLRVIRPDCCDATLNSDLGGGRVIRLGVERDASSLRPLAYYFDASRADPTATFLNSRPRVRVRASDVIHLFTPHDAGQARGFPLGHAAVRALKMLDEYRKSGLVAARDNTNTLGFFTAPAGRDGEIKPLASDEHVRNRLEEPSYPGKKTILRSGWDYKWTHPEHPNVALGPFESAILRGVASGLGVEYANFANNWAAVSYSSVRAGTLAERDQWLTLQAVLVSRVLNPLYRAWLRQFLSLRVSGGLYTSADFARLLPHEFIGRRWQWVDPMKDVSAAVVAIKNGLTTQSRVAAEFGTDADDNILENARINEAFKDAGLPSPFTPGKEAATTEKEQDDEKNQ